MDNIFAGSEISGGIIYLTPANDTFEKVYIALRKKEGNLLTIEQITQLPDFDKPIWKMRKHTAYLFKNYLKERSDYNFLEIGCGNGWFTNFISQNENCIHAYGLDVNKYELQQAVETFSVNSKITFLYADVFNADIPEKMFDVIALNGSVQYFPELYKLVDQLRMLLKENGEIHILDSPFYKTEIQKEQAGKRSRLYYSNSGFPELADHYTPHLLSDLKKFNYSIMYKPSLLSGLLRKIKLPFFRENPFYWIKISQ